MPHQIVTVPCLSDNYAFLIHNDATGHTALVDAPESEPILTELRARGWKLSHVFLTHHHWDHIDGLTGILAAQPAQVVGAKADAHRLPSLNIAVSDGDTFEFGGEPVHVIDVSGHTIGHVAFYLPDSNAVFTADSLMALGCGRLFEGSPETMWRSLSKLAALPEKTLVYSGHEYTQSNGRFAITVDPDNAALQKRIDDIANARAQNLPTVPSSLALELATNPFLRANDQAIQAQLNLQDADYIEVFTTIRQLKDAF